jgi:hypothetical protein
MTPCICSNVGFLYENKIWWFNSSRVDQKGKYSAANTKSLTSIDLNKLRAAQEYFHGVNIIFDMEYKNAVLFGWCKIAKMAY